MFQTFKLDFEIIASDGAYGPVKKNATKTFEKYWGFGQNGDWFSFFAQNNYSSIYSDGFQHKFCEKLNIIGSVAFVVVQ